MQESVTATFFSLLEANIVHNRRKQEQTSLNQVSADKAEGFFQALLAPS